MSDYDENSEAPAVEQQLVRILSSSVFAQAERLSSFLRFISDETLAGRGARLNQYVLGIEVFGRDESFDPAVDAIVRVEAGRLRAKLREFYDEVGAYDSVRVDLPKGSYTITWHLKSDKISNEAGLRETFSAKLYHSERSTNPTIAVLPFDNMSSDPEQDYFADGISEDLITDLSKNPQFSVIARQSTFAYKNAKVNLQRICGDLSADFIIEGSVRKIAERVRVNAQLIEGSTGKHIWAERYDRDIENIFALQDEINRNIVQSVNSLLSENRQPHVNLKTTTVIEAYDFVLRGMQESRTYTREGSARARFCFERALELDPHYAAAYARLSMNFIFCWIVNWSQSREESIETGLKFAKKAVSLDENLALAHTALCWACLWYRDFDAAIAAGKTAIGLEPSNVDALERLALAMAWSGNADAAGKCIDQAARLNPHEPYLFVRGVVMFMLQNYDGAIELLQASSQKNPKFLPSFLFLASSYGLASRDLETQEIVAQVQAINPNYRLSSGVYSNFKNPADQERFINGLRKAGFE